MGQSAASLRIDKWLWYARFFKTRSLAAKIVSSGAVRVNGAHVKKPSATVVVGDTLTFAKARDIRVIRILGLGVRRGPAPEAQTLYEDLSPPEIKPKAKSVRHPEASIAGRPTKKTRRDLEALKRNS